MRRGAALALTSALWILTLACGAADQSASSPAAPDTTAAVASPQVLLDLQGNGTKTTQEFTAGRDWDLQWSYDCTSGLEGMNNGVLPSGGHCSFIVHVKTPDGHFSLENQGVNQLGVKDQSVEHYHTGGTFYLEVQVCCVDNTWAVKVTG